MGGCDVRNLIRREGKILESLVTLGSCPRYLGILEQDNDLFLVEEYIPGSTLRDWVLANQEISEKDTQLLQNLRIGVKIADLVSRFHNCGVVIRDLTPNNLMVDDAGRVRLVDLELAVSTATSTTSGASLIERCGTPGYAAPEQLAGAAPQTSADIWSLAAILCWIFTGENLYVGLRTPINPSGHVRRWLSEPGCALQIPPEVGELVIACTSNDEAKRPRASQVAEKLRQIRPKSNLRIGRSPLYETTANQCSDSDLDASIETLLTALIRYGVPLGKDYFERSPLGETTDARNVQHGAAGTLAVLIQAWNLTNRHQLLEAIETSSRWLSSRIDMPHGGPVGLHFGSGGLAWVLFDAGRVLGDQEMIDTAADFTLKLDTDWPNPDMTHGRAGLGATLLHLWRLSQDIRFLQAAILIGDSLLASARKSEAGIYWQIAPGFSSIFSDHRFYGYAHGIAGIGHFLAALGSATGYSRFHEAANEIVASLLSAAVTMQGETDWPQEPTSKGFRSRPYWCHGASGIGTFLIRRYANLHDERLLPIIRGAVAAVVTARWRSGIGYCHGLAGNGDFLLDVADALGDETYLARARSLAGVLLDRRVMHRNELTFADETGAITPGFAGGTSGVLSFLLRLKLGGPRILMEELPSLRDIGSQPLRINRLDEGGVQ